MLKTWCEWVRRETGRLRQERNLSSLFVLFTDQSCQAVHGLPRDHLGRGSQQCSQHPVIGLKAKPEPQKCISKQALLEINKQMTPNIKFILMSEKIWPWVPSKRKFHWKQLSATFNPLQYRKRLRLVNLPIIPSIQKKLKTFIKMCGIAVTTSNLPYTICC